MSNSANLMRDLILGSPFLKIQDRDVVDSICSKYDITSDPGCINDMLLDQVRAEAQIVYLTGKYSNILLRLESDIEDIEADVWLASGDRSESGLKLSRTDKKCLSFCNEKFMVLRESVIGFKQLLALLERLSMIVFRKQGKLEQLSINYRRETEADKRHSF